MAERPIIFSAPMVRAILDGRKSQTRRLLKPQLPTGHKLVGIYAPNLTAVFNPAGREHRGDPDQDIAVPLRFMPKDLLWVRETWANSTNDRGPIYRADGESIIRWKSPIHMPRRLSRITLRVTNVRVQRVQEISGEDAVAEGMASHGPNRPQDDYRNIWNTLHTKPGTTWADNPWVAAITFERIDHG